MMTVDDEMKLDANEMRERHLRCQRMINKRGLSGLVAWARGGLSQDRSADVYYLSNWHPASYCYPKTFAFHRDACGHAAFVMNAAGKSILVTDIDPELTAGHSVYADSIEVVETGSLPERLATLASMSLGATGDPIAIVGADALAQPHFQPLADTFGGGRLVENYEFGANLRSVKSPRECELLRRAARVGSRGVDQILRHVDVGRTEAEITALGVGFGAKSGVRILHFGICSSPLVTYTQSQAAPWDARRPLAEGDLVRVDYAGILDGYMLDVARTRVVGDAPTETQKMMTRAAREAVQAGVAEVGPGRTFGDVARACQRSLARSDLLAAHPETDIPNWWGHSIGLRADGPRVLAESERMLEAGMSFAIETGIRRAGIGIASYEECVVVSPDGVELLTDAKDWNIASGG